MTFKQTITKRDGTEHIVKVDDKHKDLFKVKWSLNGRGYIHRPIRLDDGTRQFVLLHRVIMGLEHGDKRVVDHLNHNILDNTTANLEIKTHQENTMNKKISKNNTTGMTGVYKIHDTKWRAMIRFNDKLIHLGYFDTKEKAETARKDAEKKYFGEHSYDACQAKNNVG